MTSLVFGGLVYSAFGFDLVTSLNLSIGFLSNTGTNYLNILEFPAFLKIFSSFMMVGGRLELFAFLFLMSPRFYRGL